MTTSTTIRVFAQNDGYFAGQIYNQVTGEHIGVRVGYEGSYCFNFPLAHIHYDWISSLTNDTVEDAFANCMERSRDYVNNTEITIA